MKNKNKNKINTTKLTILLSFMLMIIIFIYIVFNSDLFNSSKIKIEGNNRILKEEIIDTLNIKEDKNIFMYNIKEMEKTLEENSHIKSVEVKRKIPNELKVLIIEKEIVAILKDKEKYSSIDSKGDLIKVSDKLDTSKDATVVEIEYSLIDEKTVEFKNEELKKGLLYLLECTRKDNLYKKINKIVFDKKDIIKIYTKEDIMIILKNDDKINYNVSMIGPILADLQGKYVKGGIIDFVSGKNPIYKPK